MSEKFQTVKQEIFFFLVRTANCGTVQLNQVTPLQLDTFFDKTIRSLIFKSSKKRKEIES